MIVLVRVADLAVQVVVVMLVLVGKVVAVGCVCVCACVCVGGTVSCWMSGTALISLLGGLAPAQKSSLDS